MKTATVSTRDELKKAKDDGVDKIIVIGDLADKLKKSKKITKLSRTTLLALSTAIGISAGASIFTGGTSLLALAPVAAYTGLEIAVIIVAATLGIALIIALYKDYEEIEYAEGRLILRKKSK